MPGSITRRTWLKVAGGGLFLLATGGASGCVMQNNTTPDNSLFLPELEEQSADLAALSPAIQWIAQRVVDMRKRLYVYKDFGSGENCFTQRLWMSEPNTPSAPAMNEDAQAVAEAPVETNGGGDANAIVAKTTSTNDPRGIYAHLDLRDFPWGGYLFLNQSDTEQTPKAGVNLGGAVELVFRARSAHGSCRVEFFMGGYNNEWRSVVPEDLRDSADRCSNGSVTLTEQWQEFRIDLRGVDLSRIICGFGWAAYNRENAGLDEVAFYVDDIYYQYPAPRNAPAFIESYAPLPSTERGFELNSAAYTYDNAVACIALLAANQDFCAQLLADALCFAVNNDFLFDDGRLRNAYAAGDPHSYPGWVNDRNEAYARLSGHWDSRGNRYVEDLYMSSSATGVLAWALLALCQAHERCPRNEDYLDAAIQLATLLLSFKDETGGFTAGFEADPRSDENAKDASGESGGHNNSGGGDGNADDNNGSNGSGSNNDTSGSEGYERVSYKSTEHNITLVAAFSLLAGLVGPAQAAVYQSASDHARAFVLTAYDSENAYFNLGIGESGQIDGSIIPLDVQTWGLLVLGDSFEERAEVLHFMEEHLAVNEGFDFSLAINHSKQRGIWTEGTAQALLCYQAAQDTQATARLEKTLTDLSNSDGSMNATDGKELFTGLYLAGTGAAWVYPPRRHLGATAWKALADMGYNPFLSLSKQRPR